MTTQSKKCVYQFDDGKKCDANAADGSSYCSSHRPAESPSSSGNSFQTGSIMYTKTDKGF